MASPPTSPSPSTPAAPPTPLAQVRSFVHRIEDKLFPPVRGPSGNPSGLLTPGLSERPAILAALGLGLLLAALLEYTMLAKQIPAGGDPGQWTSTAYAYVGLPYPSWIIPGQYPPLLFPLLGLLIRITGGPILGARAYVGVVAVLLGLSYYFLARGLTRRRSTAILADALILFNPTFLPMFFWGFYPNLFGLVFFNLCLGFLVRFIRSRRPRHVFLFWTCAAAALLTHSLVGTVLVAVGGIALVLALSIRVLPREIYRSRGGLGGIGVLLSAVGGFYVFTSFLKIPHPNYFHSGAFAYVRNGIASIFNLLTHPFFRGLKVAPGDAVPLLWVLIGALAIYAIGTRLFWKSRLTLGTILTISLALGPMALAAVGWELAVVTDYARFSYFLIAPIGLSLALTVDRVMTELRERAASAAPSVAPPPGLTHRWRLGGTSPDPPGAVAFLAIVGIAAVVVADVISLPSLPVDESETTKVGHDSTFLGALATIHASQLPGSVLTVPGVAKWTRAILVRDAYFPNLAARYTFDPAHLVDEETAYFAMTSRYAATNDLVAVTALGTNISAGNGSFEYQPAYFGVYTPVAAVPVANITVRVVHNGTITNESVLSGATVQLAPVGAASFALTYTGVGFRLTVTGFAYSAIPEASLALSVVSDPGYQLLSFGANLTGPSAGTARFQRGTAAGTFELQPGKFGSVLSTHTVVSPANALRSITQYNHPGVPAHAGFVVAAPGNGASQLLLSFNFQTPTASNLVSGIPPLIVTDTVWANWTVRFVLYSASNSQEGAVANLLPNELAYLEGEFGARVLGTSGTWTVLLLPGAGQLPTDPRPAASATVAGGAT
ncbi:MAG: hypothetical protein ACHQ16_00725 [Candidatus Lutacidiplasmatales archaeon]